MSSRIVPLADSRFAPFTRLSTALAGLSLVAVLALSACAPQSLPNQPPPDQPEATADESAVVTSSTQVNDESQNVDVQDLGNDEIASLPPDQVYVEPIIARPEALKVGLLVPLTGARQAEGKALLDAAQMALFEVGDDRFTLVPADTASTPDGARLAANKVVDSGVSLVIGPLLSDEAKAAAPLVRARGVNMVSFSNNPSATGGGVYLMGHMVAPEIDRLVGHARANELRRFAILAPGDGYGRLVTEQARRAVAEVGGTLGVQLLYPPSANPPELDKVVQTLASGERFDALILPDGGPRLSRVLPLLLQYGVDPATIRFLGTSLWDDPKLREEPALMGAWYVSPSPEGRAAFKKRFADAYGYEPSQFAAIGYDATALAVALAKGTAGPDFSTQAIGDARGFAGTEGIFRFMPDGTSERGLAVVEIGTGGTINLVSPALDRFPTSATAGSAGSGQ